MRYIRFVQLTGLDLNLLVAADALLDEAHVGRAAARLGLSQPAASHALRRLRELFGDPLLVRTGATMARTPRAEALRAPLSEALATVTAVFATERFEPATATRRFTLMLPDLAAALLLPPLVARAAATAPGIGFAVAPWRGTGDIAGLDAIVSYGGHDFPGCHRRRLYADRDALAVRAAHPGEPGTALGFAAARHIAVRTHGQPVDPIDTWLAGLGVTRRVALAVPTYLQALHVAAASDLVAFVPGRLIAAAGLPLTRVMPPWDPGLDEQFLFTPAQHVADPAARWLAALLTAAGRGIDKAA